MEELDSLLGEDRNEDNSVQDEHGSEDLLARYTAVGDVSKAEAKHGRPYCHQHNHVRGVDPSQKIRGCKYPYCESPLHNTLGCPVLHGACSTCSMRGHVSAVCRPLDLKRHIILRKVFHDHADLGLYTRLRKQHPEWDLLVFRNEREVRRFPTWSWPVRTYWNKIRHRNEKAEKRRKVKERMVTDKTQTEKKNGNKTKRSTQQPGQSGS